MNFFSRATAATGALAVVGALAIAPSAAFGSQSDDAPPVLRPAAAALADPLAPGTYPGDVPTGPVIVMFSNGAFTDPAEEDWDIATVLLPGSSELRVTNGGDASAATWTTVLTGADLLVLPEGGNWEPGGTSAISDEALEVIRTWVSAGRVIVGTGSYDHGIIVSELTGVDYVAEFDNDVDDGPWQRVGGDTSLPAELPNAEWTGALGDFSTFTPEQNAVITPLYVNDVTGSLAVGSFAIGAGQYLYLAYDWYPDADDIDGGIRDVWNGLLVSVAADSNPAPAPAPAPVPELADTGAAA